MNMKRFLIFLLILSWVGIAEGAIWYVDSAVTDTYVASATPDFTTYNPTTFATDTGSDSVYKTIADINAFSALAAGDSVLFRKSQTWREQLTVSATGTEGNIITLGAYGTGSDPIISGADLISSWTEEGGGEDFTDSRLDPPVRIQAHPSA